MTLTHCLGKLVRLLLLIPRDPVHVPGEHGCNGKLILTSQSDATGIAARDSLIGFGRRDGASAHNARKKRK